MAFTCIECAPKEAEWLFTLAMGLSHGQCECCNKISNCIDWKGEWDQSRKAEPLDTYRYDCLSDER